MAIGDLGLDVEVVKTWFSEDQRTQFTLVQVEAREAQEWVDALGHAIRRCYITDDKLAERTLATGLSGSEVASSVMPDPSAVMAGDFGEILVYLFQSSSVLPEVALGPKKWRLKEARTKAAPYSDVVQFVLPEWPASSDRDRLLCAESKVKSTNGKSEPVTTAIEGCARDRTSRLAATLNWLRDRAIRDDIGDVSIAQINRFIQADLHPTAERVFQAIAIVSSDLLADELSKVPAEEHPEYSLIIFSFGDLYTVYNAVYAAAIASAVEVA